MPLLVSAGASTHCSYDNELVGGRGWHLEDARTRRLEACATRSAAILAAGSGGFQPPGSKKMPGCARF